MMRWSLPQPKLSDAMALLRRLRVVDTARPPPLTTRAGERERKGKGRMKEANEERRKSKQMQT